MLTKRYQQFQRRMARHYINTVNIEGNIEGDNNNNNATNSSNNNGSNNSGSNNSGSNGSNSNNNTNNENNNENRERRALTSLPLSVQPSQSQRPATTHTVTTAHTTNPDSRHRSVSTTRTTLNTPLTSTIQNTVSVPARTNATFQIFSDDSPTNSEEPGTLTENENWRNLGTQSNKRKENDGMYVFYSFCVRAYVIMS